MTGAEEKVKPRSVIERHAQTVIAAIILGLCVWMATSVSTMTTAVAVLQSRLGAIEQRLTDFRGLMNDRYRKDDAERDFRSRDIRLDSIERRLDRLENQGLPRIPKP